MTAMSPIDKRSWNLLDKKANETVIQTGSKFWDFQSIRESMREKHKDTVQALIINTKFLNRTPISQEIELLIGEIVKS